ncbi:MAG TPA: glycosyltransferase [Pseudomonadales bacterium]|nr:glycosyltransferase [Pseudomonadales bacterium]
MPNIALIIGSVWPEPRSSAAGSHMLQIIEQLLLHNYNVVFASAAKPGENRADLATIGILEKTIALNCPSFDNWVHELNPDVVFFDRFMTEEQFGWRVEAQCPQALRILETSDLHCLRMARQMLLKPWLAAGHDSTPALNEDALYMAMLQQDIALREIAAIYRCDLSLIISRFEMHLLAHCFSVPMDLLLYCPFLLDSPDKNNWGGIEQRQHFISIGNFLHAPNWDAVQWLKKSIWPKIHAQLPTAQLHVYGAYTPQKARELNNEREGFLIKGWAEDALTVMAQARVCLAPLRFGAGIKGKLVDAMLAGTPSVTTSIGAESMHATLPWNGLIADETQEFANAAVRLYQDNALWLQAQQHGNTILQQCFNKAGHGLALIQQLKSIRQNIERHRQKNFTGSMLRHHQHKSTYYMARWIEEKNSKIE